MKISRHTEKWRKKENKNNNNNNNNHNNNYRSFHRKVKRPNKGLALKGNCIYEYYFTFSLQKFTFYYHPPHFATYKEVGHNKKCMCQIRKMGIFS